MSAEESDNIEILDEKVVERLQENPAAYDKGGGDALRYNLRFYQVDPG